MITTPKILLYNAILKGFLSVDLFKTKNYNSDINLKEFKIENPSSVGRGRVLKIKL